LGKIRYLWLPALAVLATMLRYHAFSQTPYANGWDSYFYLVQLKSLETTGHMHSPEASLIYPYLRVFYWITGDYVTGMKWAMATLCGLWVALLGSMDFSPSGQKAFMPSPCALKGADPDAPKRILPLWALFSPHLTYFAAQYPKNLLGLLLFLFFVRSLHRPFPGKTAWLVPAALLLLNYFGHRMTFGLSVAYLVLFLFFQYGTRLLDRAALRKWAFAVVGAIVLFLLAGQVFPGLAHLADLGRLGGLLRPTPQFAPWSFVQTLGWQRMSPWWLFEIAAVTGFFVWSLVVAFRRKETANLPMLVLCAALLFPFMEWSSTGLAWRCWMVFVLLAPLAGMFPFGKKAGVWGAALLLLASFFSWKSYQPALQDPDYAQFEKITLRTQAFFGNSLRPELVIAHNALAEYFTFTTGTDAMPWLPEYTIDSTRLWRIAAGVHLPTLQYFSGEHNLQRIKNLGSHYFLLPEQVWQAALARAHAEQDTVFLETAESWRNPWKMRPGWLLRRKGG